MIFIFIFLTQFDTWFLNKYTDYLFLKHLMYFQKLVG